MVLERGEGESAEREDSRSVDHGVELISLDITLARFVLEFFRSVSSFSTQFSLRR